MKIDFDISDCIINKLNTIDKKQFESYKFLKEVEEFSRVFESTLNEKQKQDFDILLEIIDDYQVSKEREIVCLTVNAYKSLFK